jgi:hypothetical protein
VRSVPLSIREKRRPLRIWHLKGGAIVDFDRT